jgi:vacuolar-type H+-ATPase subunit H
MEPATDGAILKRIFSAERDADRIVREAEAQAADLLAAADAKAAGMLAERRRALAAWRMEALATAVREADAEAERILAGARDSTSAWSRRETERIDALAARLLEAVLPP